MKIRVQFVLCAQKIQTDLRKFRFGNVFVPACFCQNRNTNVLKIRNCHGKSTLFLMNDFETLLHEQTSHKPCICLAVLHNETRMTVTRQNLHMRKSVLTS